MTDASDHETDTRNDDEDREAYSLVTEQDKAGFHQAYGEAMSSFGAVEGALMYLFAVLFRPGSPLRAYDIFWNELNFKGQVKLVSTFIEGSGLDVALQADWSRLADRIGEAQTERNRIAHMHVWEMRGRGLFGHSPKKDIGKLPVDWTARQKNEHVFTTERLETLAKGFAALSRSVRKFEKAVNKSLNK